jgi:hypothetical protein
MSICPLTNARIRVDILMLMPALAPATRKARDEVRSAICLTIGV